MPVDIETIENEIANNEKKCSERLSSWAYPKAATFASCGFAGPDAATWVSAGCSTVTKCSSGRSVRLGAGSEALAHLGEGGLGAAECSVDDFVIHCAGHEPVVLGMQVDTF